MITFYFVCKNGSHDKKAEEVVKRFELNADYQEGLKMFRCIINIFQDWIRVSKILGRTN